MVGRRDFLKGAAAGLLGLGLSPSLFSAEKDKPNIILCMADDLGWADVGFNGSEKIKTPELDKMAAASLKFERFYAAAPVCSPTRGSCLTGRHPYRYGVFFANTGHLRKEEVSLAEAVKTRGYATGHFGKWHLGTLLPDYSGKGRGRNPGKNYITPSMAGFDEWFSTEYAVATWNPYDPDNAHGRYDVRNLYWHNGRNVKQPLEGDDSRIIMDKALPFIRSQAKARKPFLAVIWFHAPHAPVVAGPGHRAVYSRYSEDEQHYYGCITAMDQQIGRLRKELRQLKIADNTMLWFCSDNGPEGRDGKTGRFRGSAGPYSGRKRSLLEGGVRVPGLLEWPAKIKGPRTTDMPCCTSDYFPTVLDVLGLRMKNKPEPVDGISLVDLIHDRMKLRPVPIAFQSRKQLSLTDNRYKIYSSDRGKTYKLFDLLEDPGEKADLAPEKPRIVAAMRKKLEKWQADCKDSLEGKDYK